MEKGPPLPSRQTDQSFVVLILAAGLGTRMKSARAKVLHELGGLPLITYVCRTAQALNPDTRDYPDRMSTQWNSRKELEAL